MNKNKMFDQKIFVISDTHFGQWFANWFFNRPFKNIKNMEDTIIDNWNKTVTDRDFVIIVGDFFSGSQKYLDSLVSRLNGKKILIKGNHDFKIRYLKLIKNKEIEVYNAFRLNIKDVSILFTHKALPILDRNTINIHGHYHRKIRPFHVDSVNYFNACVDHNDYTPVDLSVIIEKYLKEKAEHKETILDYISNMAYFFVQSIKLNNKNLLTD